MTSNSEAGENTFKAIYRKFYSNHKTIRLYPFVLCFIDAFAFWIDSATITEEWQLLWEFESVVPCMAILGASFTKYVAFREMVASIADISKLELDL